MNNKWKGLVPPDIPGDGRWLSMHQRYITMAGNSKSCDILFIGDSIVQQMEFTKFYTNNIPKGAIVLNFGIGGDKVENVLWRIQDGDWLENLKPKVLVLFVGTNNIQSTPEEVIELLVIVIRVINKKTPKSHIIMPLLLPRGQHKNPLRDKNNHVNDLIKCMINTTEYSNFVTIVDMEKEKKLVDDDGTIDHHILHDYLHLTEMGYSLLWKRVFDECINILNKT